MARALLHDSGLPANLWDYAFRKASFIFNRLIHGDRDKTPCEAALGFKLNIDMLRVFKCTAYVLDHTHLKQLGAYGKKLRHIGSCHDSKGWFFWDEDTGKITKALSAKLIKKDANKDTRGSLAAIELLVLGDFWLGNELDKQDAFIAQIAAVIAHNPENTSYNKAVNSDEAKDWRELMGEEVDDLKRMGVFEEVDLPIPKEKTLGVKWVLVKKRDQSGALLRRKSQLVAQGFQQVQGISYEETFVPTPTFALLRAALVMAAKLGWTLATFDVKTAFLHSDIDKELYIKDPPGTKVTPGKILRLKKSFYGTKQAGRCWWLHLKLALERLGFKSNAEDQSTYSWEDPDGKAFLRIHVDDGLLTASSEELLSWLQKELSDCLTLKWDNKISSIVGIQIDKTERGFELHQPALICKLGTIKKTSMSPNTPLLNKDLISNLSDLESLGIDTEYLRRTGILLYLTQGSRPDIYFAVHYLARFSLQPDDTHWAALRRLIAYVLSTADYDLQLEPNTVDDDSPVKTFVDANWGGEGARSRHGFIATLWGAPIAWNSRRQTCVAPLTCQAEYVALSFAAMKSIWIGNLVKPFTPGVVPLILSDNKAAVKIAGNKESMNRTQHINREFHFVNEQLRKGKAKLQWVDGKRQLGDAFTKALGTNKLVAFASKIFGQQLRRPHSPVTNLPGRTNE